MNYVIVDDSRRGDQPPNVMDPETYGEVSRCATYEYILPVRYEAVEVWDEAGQGLRSVRHVEWR